MQEYDEAARRWDEVREVRMYMADGDYSRGEVGDIECKRVRLHPPPRSPKARKRWVIRNKKRLTTVRNVLARCRFVELYGHGIIDSSTRPPIDGNWFVQ